jgi:hypothetical protein
MVLAPFVNYNMDAIFPFCAEAAQGEIYQNTFLLPDYPAYVAPVFNKTELVALVFIWHASFKQYSTYYHNLFKVMVLSDFEVEAHI